MKVGCLKDPPYLFLLATQKKRELDSKIHGLVSHVIFIFRKFKSFSTIRGFNEKSFESVCYVERIENVFITETRENNVLTVILFLRAFILSSVL